MTLAQWAKFTGKVVHDHKHSDITGAKWVADYYGEPEEYRADLWRLEDYVVSSVLGGSIWLVPRLGDSAPNTALIITTARIEE